MQDDPTRAQSEADPPPWTLAEHRARAPRCGISGMRIHRYGVSCVAGAVWPSVAFFCEYTCEFVVID